MIEVCKVPCPAPGCDLTAGRVVRDGGRVLFSPSRNVRHHGRDHGLLDLDALDGILARVRREQISLTGSDRSGVK